MSGAPQRTETGILYVVATPIGNLKDITLRALEVLKSVDYIASEDTRTTLKLLNHFGLRGPQLIAYHEHNEAERAPKLLAKLKEGAQIALVSEAGTPGLSDPGATLVSLAHQEGIPVCPIPGPSALATALSASGFNLRQGFLFLGFLPAKKNERRKLLQEVAQERRPLVFFEAPHRLRQSLEDLVEILGERKAFLAREMTKRHEEYVLGNLKAFQERFSKEEPRGEFTLVVEGSAAPKISLEEAEEELHRLLEAGKSLKEASRLVAQKTGLPAKELYRLGLKRR